MNSERDGRKHEKKWRVLAHTETGPVEFEDQGIFDELVLDSWLHVEQLDDHVWWMRIGDARVNVTLSPNGEPTVDIERGFYAETKGATATESSKS